MSAPAGIVRLAGKVTAVFVLDSATTAPPVGAVPFNVIVSVAFAPPITVAGLILTDKRTAGVTVRFALFVTPEETAEIATVAVEETPEVETGNVALVAPGATVILAGTLATLTFPLDSVTTRPPAGAAPVSVTVPVEAAPLTTEAGVKPRVERAILTLTVSTAVFTPL